MALLIDKTFIVNKDTTNFSNNTIIKKGTIVQGKMTGIMPNGDVRITTNNGEIINSIDLQEQSVISDKKVPLSISNPTLVANMKLEEEKKFTEMKKKSLANTLAKASIVPIGLYAFSKYNKYDTKKT